MNCNLFRMGKHGTIPKTRRCDILYSLGRSNICDDQDPITFITPVCAQRGLSQCSRTQCLRCYVYARGCSAQEKTDRCRHILFLLLMYLFEATMCFELGYISASRSWKALDITVGPPPVASLRPIILRKVT